MSEMPNIVMSHPQSNVEAIVAHSPKPFSEAAPPTEPPSGSTTSDSEEQKISPPTLSLSDNAECGFLTEEEKSELGFGKSGTMKEGKMCKLI